MSLLTFSNPVFRLYALAAGLMMLKMMSHSWLTVYRMMKVKAGFRNPEDLRKTPLNPNPNDEQLRPNEYVERTRRIHQNELENVPLFLVAGLLWVCSDPSFGVAAAVFGVYVVSRFIHFAVVMLEKTHDARATAWTFGSLAIYWMAGSVVVAAVRSLI